MDVFSRFEVFDVPEYIVAGFLAGLVNLVIQPLRLDRAKEGFRACIVPVVSLPAHAADHLESRQGILVVVTAILDTTIRVMNQSKRGSMHLDGIRQRLKTKLSSHVLH